VSLEPRRAALLDVRDAPGEAAAWTIRGFAPAAGFSGALAIRHPAPCVDVRHVSAAQIFADAGLI
jgi:hypothetical protein